VSERERALDEPPACTRCASPIEDGDLRCAVCALPVEVAARPAARATSSVLRCTECGAAIAFDGNRGAPACGFCGAVMKVEQPEDPVEQAQRRVPFAVDRDGATAALRVWLGRRGLFAPRTLRDEAVLESLVPLYWAAWVVNAKAIVAWTADSDEGARRSAWAPHAGELELELDNIVVPASRGLSVREAGDLVPYYDLERATAIDGAGDGLVEGFDVQRSAARDHVHRALETYAKVRVKAVVPGRKVRNIHVSCLLERQATDRVVLPAWVLAYRYRGAPYRAIVHGQRAAAVFGHSPIDWRKVLLLVGGIAAAVAAIIVAIALSR